MPTAPDSLRKKIQQLQTKLSAIEAQQTSARRAALAFLRRTIDTLGLSAADVSEALAGRDGGSGRTGRRRGRPAGPRKPATRPSLKNGAGSGVGQKKRTGTAKPRIAKKTAGAKVPAKYRGPDGETWTGRGKQPRWLAALVATGRTPAEFLITK
jgi:DNA-binding protein H-NS